MGAYNVSLEVEVTVTVNLDDDHHDDDDYEHNASEMAMEVLEGFASDTIKFGDMTCTGVQWTKGSSGASPSGDERKAEEEE